MNPKGPESLYKPVVSLENQLMVKLFNEYGLITHALLMYITDVKPPFTG